MRNFVFPLFYFSDIKREKQEIISIWIWLLDFVIFVGTETNIFGRWGAQWEKCKFKFKELN